MLDVLFRLDLPHGRCVGVEIPDDVSESDLVILPAAERAAAAAMPAPRRPGWVAGRLALRAALEDLGVSITSPLLATERGAPLVPAGALGSISHKRTLAVALAAPAAGPACAVGVDIELDADPRVDISRRILTPTELADYDRLPTPARRHALLLRLSAKESIYKALDPFVSRYVSFQEAELTFAPDGTAQTTLNLVRGEGPFTTEVHWTTVPGHLLTTARISPCP